MKSIRRKITVCLMVTVLLSVIAVGGSSIMLNYKSTVATVDAPVGQSEGLWFGQGETTL